VAISALERPRATSAATSRSRAVSAPLLAEVQATADHLVIIDQGRVVASGSQASLLAGAGQTLEALFLSLTTPKEAVR
jgi:ABC-type Na+ transport system ATPase subunit NatA